MGRGDTPAHYPTTPVGSRATKAGGDHHSVSTTHRQYLALQSLSYGRTDVPVFQSFILTPSYSFLLLVPDHLSSCQQVTGDSGVEQYLVEAHRQVGNHTP